MGDLLHKDLPDFSSPEFWKKFFAQRKLPFEWYGDYATLGPAIERYFKVSDQLYDNGFRNIDSVDIEERVISDQRKRNSGRSELNFAVESATALSAADGSKTIVIDKGTLDALLPPKYSDEQLNTVNAMFKEVDRVLCPNGRYIVITLAQKHIVAAWFKYFSTGNKYILDVVELPTRAKGFCMPVFFFVAMKLFKPMPTLLPVNFLRNVSLKPVKMYEDELYDVLKAEQELSRFVSMCASVLTEEGVIRMGEYPDLGPRYTFTIVDRKDVKEIKSYACFVVPLGKEREWLFSHPQGRQCLLTQTQCDRLTIASLNRKHTYVDQEQIKNEINDFIARFDPRPDNNIINILSIGGIDARNKITSGTSEINGEWHVEEIDKEDYVSRQLVFESNTSLTQSEAFLKRIKDKLVLDTELLACSHHYMMIASLGLHASQPLKSISNTEIKIALLGLGGGLLATFLVQHFPRITLTAVELDKDMVSVATKHFGFPSNNKRVNVKVMDALQFIGEVADGPKNAKLDAIFVDVAGPPDEQGLSCPPAAFLEETVLENMKKSLRNNGILALNLVTRNKAIAEKYRKIVHKVFPKMYRLEAEEDLNELLIGVLTQAEQAPDVLANANHFLTKTGNAEWKEHVAGWLERIRPV